MEKSKKDEKNLPLLTPKNPDGTQRVIKQIMVIDPKKLQLAGLDKKIQEALLNAKNKSSYKQKDDKLTMAKRILNKKIRENIISKEVPMKTSEGSATKESPDKQIKKILNKNATKETPSKPRIKVATLKSLMPPPATPVTPQILKFNLSQQHSSTSPSSSSSIDIILSSPTKTSKTKNNDIPKASLKRNEQEIDKSIEIVEPKIIERKVISKGVKFEMCKKEPKSNTKNKIASESVEPKAKVIETMQTFEMFKTEPKINTKKKIASESLEPNAKVIDSMQTFEMYKSEPKINTKKKIASESFEPNAKVIDSMQTFEMYKSGPEINTKKKIVPESLKHNAKVIDSMQTFEMYKSEPKINTEKKIASESLEPKAKVIGSMQTIVFKKSLPKVIESKVLSPAEKIDLNTLNVKPKTENTSTLVLSEETSTESITPLKKVNIDPIICLLPKPVPNESAVDFINNLSHMFVSKLKEPIKSAIPKIETSVYGEDATSFLASFFTKQKKPLDCSTSGLQSQNDPAKNDPSKPVKQKQITASDIQKIETKPVVKGLTTFCPKNVKFPEFDSTELTNKKISSSKKHEAATSAIITQEDYLHTKKLSTHQPPLSKIEESQQYESSLNESQNLDHSYIQETKIDSSGVETVSVPKIKENPISEINTFYVIETNQVLVKTDETNKTILPSEAASLISRIQNETKSTAEKKVEHTTGFPVIKKEEVSTIEPFGVSKEDTESTLSQESNTRKKSKKPIPVLVQKLKKNRKNPVPEKLPDNSIETRESSKDSVIQEKVEEKLDPTHFVSDATISEYAHVSQSQEENQTIDVLGGKSNTPKKQNIISIDASVNVEIENISTKISHCSESEAGDKFPKSLKPENSSRSREKINNFSQLTEKASTDIIATAASRHININTNEVKNVPQSSTKPLKDDAIIIENVLLLDPSIGKYQTVKSEVVPETSSLKMESISTEKEIIAKHQGNICEPQLTINEAIQKHKRNSKIDSFSKKIISPVKPSIEILLSQETETVQSFQKPTEAQEEPIKGADIKSLQTIDLIKTTKSKENESLKLQDLETLTISENVSKKPQEQEKDIKNKNAPEKEKQDIITLSNTKATIEDNEKKDTKSTNFTEKVEKAKSKIFQNEGKPVDVSVQSFNDKKVQQTTKLVDDFVDESTLESHFFKNIETPYCNPHLIKISSPKKIEKSRISTKIKEQQSSTPNETNVSITESQLSEKLLTKDCSETIDTTNEMTNTPVTKRRGRPPKKCKLSEGTKESPKYETKVELSPDISANTPIITRRGRPSKTSKALNETGALRNVSKVELKDTNTERPTTPDLSDKCSPPTSENMDTPTLKGKRTRVPNKSQQNESPELLKKNDRRSSQLKEKEINIELTETDLAINSDRIEAIASLPDADESFETTNTKRKRGRPKKQNNMEVATKDRSATEEQIKTSGTTEVKKSNEALNATIIEYEKSENSVSMRINIKEDVMKLMDSSISEAQNVDAMNISFKSNKNEELSTYHEYADKPSTSKSILVDKESIKEKPTKKIHFDMNDPKVLSDSLNQSTSSTNRTPRNRKKTAKFEEYSTKNPNKNNVQKDKKLVNELDLSLSINLAENFESLESLATRLSGAKSKSKVEENLFDILKSVKENQLKIGTNIQSSSNLTTIHYEETDDNSPVFDDFDSSEQVYHGTTSKIIATVMEEEKKLKKIEDELQKSKQKVFKSFMEVTSPEVCRRNDPSPIMQAEFFGFDEKEIEEANKSTSLRLSQSEELSQQLESYRISTAKIKPSFNVKKTTWSCGKQQKAEEQKWKSNSAKTLENWLQTSPESNKKIVINEETEDTTKTNSSIPPKKRRIKDDINKEEKNKKENIVLNAKTPRRKVPTTSDTKTKSVTTQIKIENETSIEITPNPTKPDKSLRVKKIESLLKPENLKHLESSKNIKSKKRTREKSVEKTSNLEPPRKKRHYTKKTQNQIVKIEPEASISVPLPENPVKKRYRTPKNITEFNPRLLLIRRREELKNDDPIVDPNLQKEPNSPYDVQCALCLGYADGRKWIMHVADHYGIGWVVGTQPPVNIYSRSSVLNYMVEFFKQSKIKSLSCRLCNNQRRSGLGLLVHLEQCSLTPEEVSDGRLDCEYCRRNYSKLSLPIHLKTCPELTKKIIAEKIKNNANEVIDEGILSNTGRLKRKSVIKAENIIKKLETNEFVPDELIKHIVAVNLNSGLEKWHREIESFGQGYCVQKKCTFTSENVDELIQHHQIDNCSFYEKPGYVCMKCKFHDEDIEEVRNHVVLRHTPKPLVDFEISDDEAVIESDILSSDSISSGVDENEEEGSESRKKKHKIVKRIKNHYSSPPTKDFNKILPGRDSRIDAIVANFYNEFIINHYSPNSLYIFAKPSAFQVDNPSESYFPKSISSMKFVHNAFSGFVKEFGCTKVQSEQWKQLSRFQGLAMPTENIMFMGGPVKCFAWAPLQPNPPSTTQYLAVIIKKGFDKHIRYLKQKHNRSLVYIIKYEITSTNIIGNICYVFTIDAGPINCIEFLPSGGYAPEINRLGLLAVGTVETDIKIYSLPLKVEVKDCDMFPTLQLEPSFKLCLEFGSNTNENTNVCESQCVQIAWSQTNGHEFIVAAYLNGFVSIWNINDDEDNLNRFLVNETRVFTPSSYFYTLEDRITSLQIHYDKNGIRWMAVASATRKIRMYDIRDICQPILFYKDATKNYCTCLNWPIVWENVTNGFSDVLPSYGSVLNTISPINLVYSSRRFDKFCTGVNDIDFNVWRNLYATGTDNGDIAASLLREAVLDVSCRMKNDLKVISSLDMIPLDDCIGEANILKQLPDGPRIFENDYKEKIGIAFGTIQKIEGVKNPKFYGDRRIPPIHLRRLVRVTKVRFNSNKNVKDALAVGYENGFLRILNHSWHEKRNML